MVIPTLAIISFAFYLLAEFDGLISGTPEDEIDQIIQERIKEIVNEAEFNETLIETTKIKKNSN